jgi:hypothetical protein
MGKVKTTVYLDDVEYRRLKRLADQRGTSAAELIREAVSQLIRGPGEDHRPHSFGLGRSGSGDLSERSKKLLRDSGAS